jgi:hypothetical protein
VVRGQIVGFTAQAAARMKRFILENAVPFAFTFAFTFTVRRADLSEDAWRGMMKAMNMRMTRMGVAAVWRIELQRRGVPHLHVALWLPLDYRGTREDAIDEITEAWLEITGEKNDAAAREHAVHWKAILSPGWAVYMALHDGKKKEGQLGWQGKQWGIWNRRLFKRVEPNVGEMSDHQSRVFQRWFNRFLYRNGAKVRVPRSGSFQRMCKTDTVIAMAIEIQKRIKAGPNGPGMIRRVEVSS